MQVGRYSRHAAGSNLVVGGHSRRANGEQQSGGLTSDGNKTGHTRDRKERRKQERASEEASDATGSAGGDAAAAASDDADTDAGVPVDPYL